LGGNQSIAQLVAADGRLTRQRDLAWQRLTAIPGVSCVKPKGALYLFPKFDPAVYPIADDQAFITELLEQEKVLLVQGTGFNWPKHDHVRVVFLPHADEMNEALDRIERFLANYRARYGT
jgi:alanine-synthesizing transaminase